MCNFGCIYIYVYVYCNKVCFIKYNYWWVDLEGGWGLEILRNLNLLIFYLINIYIFFGILIFDFGKNFGIVYICIY